MKNFENFEGDWDKVMHDVANWTQQHVRPHNLVSISIYEEEHPNNKQEINASVYFRGDQEEAVSIPESIRTPLYEFKMLHQGGVWADVYAQGKEQLESIGYGAQNNALVATGNHSVDNSKRQVVFYWSKDAQETLNSTARANCDCVIF